MLLYTPDHVKKKIVYMYGPVIDKMRVGDAFLATDPKMADNFIKICYRRGIKTARRRLKDGKGIKIIIKAML